MNRYWILALMGLMTNLSGITWAAADNSELACGSEAITQGLNYEKRASNTSSCLDVQLVYLNGDSKSPEGLDKPTLNGGFGLTYALAWQLVSEPTNAQSGSTIAIHCKDATGKLIECKKGEYFPGTQFIDEVREHYNVSMRADGTYAFNESKPPKDFIKARIDGVYSRKSFSAMQSTDAPSVDNPGVVDASTLWLDVGFTGSYEMDQHQEHKARTYGLTSFFSFAPKSNSAFTRLNPLDWPFRSIRAATGLGDTPSRYSLPTLVFDIEQVDPEKDEQRKILLGNLDTYTRAHLEVAFTTTVGQFGGKTINFDLSRRLYQEINSPSAIESAGLDQFLATFAALRLDGGWRLTYASGRLPFDKESERVWGVGYNILY